MLVHVRRSAPDIRLVLIAYALAVAIGVIALPLRIPEVLHLLGAVQHSWAAFVAWMAKAPGSAPLSYFAQLPFVLAMGATRFSARLPSLVFALASWYLFWHIARRIPLRRPYLALTVFALLPLHYASATQALGAEQALFLLLLATVFFLRLIENPTVKWAVWYGAALTLCIYTERLSVLPALGYLLALFAFVSYAQFRRVIWFALAPTFAPAVLFLPYYFWARMQVSTAWPHSPQAPRDTLPIHLQALNLVGGGSTGYVLSVLLVIGLFSGIWGLFRGGPASVGRSLRIVCMFAGAFVAILVLALLAVWNGSTFNSAQALCAMPGVVLSSLTALDRLEQARARRFWAYAAVTVFLSLCVMSDFDYIAAAREDLAYETALIRPQLTGDSCVVFVSQAVSKPMFLVFDPGLEQHVCFNFFHRRAVLASHAYVLPEQQENAESFFRGLNFAEIERTHAGGGQIVVVESRDVAAAATRR